MIDPSIEPSIVEIETQLKTLMSAAEKAVRDGVAACEQEKILALQEKIKALQV